MNKYMIALLLICIVGATLLTSIVFIFALPAWQKQQVNTESRSILSKFTVKVYEWGLTWKTYPISLDSTLVQILHYHEGGYVLATDTPVRNTDECAWELVVGVEDFAVIESGQTKGDFCDIIIKIIKYKTTGDIWIAVGALGGFREQILYNSILKLDTAGTDPAVPTRFAQWKL
jgi:hypothetical protein